VSYGGLATASIRSTRLLAQTTILSVKVNVKRKGGVSKAAPPAPANAVPAASPTQAPTPAPTPMPTPKPTPPPAGTGVYGPGINADTLNNSQVGGRYNEQVAYRFRATETSALTSIRIYIIANGDTGYSNGTGGTIRADVYADDGTASHLPTGSSLASGSMTPGNPAGFPPDSDTSHKFPTITFSTPATLVAGTLYHIVFRNADPSPTVNFLSVDGLYVYADLPACQPAFPDTDWANLVKPAAGSWSTDRGAGRGATTPIMALNYANGRVGGMGYMETWEIAPKTISGSMAAREAFTVSGSSRQVSSVSVRLKRVSGSSPLLVRLETSNGSLVEQGSIPASSIPTTGYASWATYTFASSHTLATGQSYHLVLSSASDTSYSIFVIRKGVDYGFSPKTYFADGSGQYNPGSGWVAFDPGWRDPLDQGDLQFYFE